MRKSCLSLTNAAEAAKVDILDDIILQSSTSTPQCMIPQQPQTPLDIPNDGIENGADFDSMFDELWAKEAALSKLSLPPPPLVSPLPASKDDEVQFVEFRHPQPPPKMDKGKTGPHHHPKGGKMQGPLLKKALKMAEKKNSQMRHHPYDQRVQRSDMKPVRTEKKQPVRTESKTVRKPEPEPRGAASDDDDFECFSQPDERQAVKTVVKIVGGVDQKLAVEKKKAEDVEVEIQRTREKLARLEETLNLHRRNIVRIERKKTLLAKLFK